MNIFKSDLIISLLSSFIVASIVATLCPQGSFLNSWLTASLLLWISFYFLYKAWKWAGSSKTLAWMMVLCFLLRLFGGIGLSLALPHFGYDNEHQNAGYMFKDSFYRDTAAWDLAKSQTPLLAAFREEFGTDQYGGLLSLSAAVYRYISPDAHRSFLILILAAFTASIGIPFFWKAIQQRWHESLANLASWFYVLYPEGIFYSVSQMREPFMIGGIAILFWTVLNWNKSRRLAICTLSLSVALMLMISWRIAIIIILVSLVLFWIEHYSQPLPKLKNSRKWIFIITGFLMLIAIISSLTWLRTSMWWDFRMTENNSARLVLEIERIGNQFRAPIIVAFGVAQVVLPAAIAQPAIALWRGLTIFRSAGWYILIPILLYSLTAVIRETNKKDQRTIFWMVLASFAWILLSSARAGGDLWDNPRYRTIFMPWMVFLAAWAWQWASAHRDQWLKRIYLMEAVFLGFFTEWYLVRYYIGTMWVRLPFWTMIAWIFGLSTLIILGGFFWDSFQRRKSRNNITK